MVLVGVADDVVDAVFAGGGGVVGGAEADGGEAAVAAAGAGLAAEDAEPVDGAGLVGVEAEFGEVVEVGGFGCGVEGAEEGVFFFAEP